MNCLALALVGLTVTGCGLILLALTTPGWIGMDIKSLKEEENTDSSFSISPFYARVCEDLEFEEVCETVSMAKVISNADADTSYSKNMGMAHVAVDRYEEWLLEATLCFICITIGGILAIIFGSSIMKTQDGTGVSSICLTVTGLVFSTIGWTFGAILAVQFIIVQVGLEEEKDLIDKAVSAVSDVKIDYEVPYSLIIMCIGLFFEFLAVIVHIATIRTNYRAMPVNGMVLAPSIYGPSKVVELQSKTSSTPYARFA